MLNSNQLQAPTTIRYYHNSFITLTTPQLGIISNGERTIPLMH